VLQLRALIDNGDLDAYWRHHGTPRAPASLPLTQPAGTRPHRLNARFPFRRNCTPARFAPSTACSVPRVPHTVAGPSGGTCGEPFQGLGEVRRNADACPRGSRTNAPTLRTPRWPAPSLRATDLTDL
jgi:hypothetical protein